MDVKLFRFVDDYLVSVKNCLGGIVLPEVIKTFRRNGFRLEYTVELPKESKIQLLDLVIKLTPFHTCWMYKPRSTKPLLSYESAHSKLVKNGVATSCIKTA